MRAKELEAVGELAGAALAGGARLVQDMHEGIAGRPFGALGAAAAPARLAHDGISRTVYAGVRAALRSGPGIGGADVEKGLNVVASALGRLPETRAFGRVLNARSVGIKDMRFGACVEEDWCDCHPDEFLRDRCHEVPFLPEANCYFIGTTLSPGPIGAGRHRRIPFEVDNGRRLTGLNHFDLLNDPGVYEQLRDWITRADEA